MPRGDGTGPAGIGRLSGRKLGFCAGFRMPGFRNYGFDRFYGPGRNRWLWRTPWIVAGLLSGGGYLAYRLMNQSRTRR